MLDPGVAVFRHGLREFFSERLSIALLTDLSVGLNRYSKLSEKHN
jgi:hypothetical protein